VNQSVSFDVVQSGQKV